MYLKHLVQIVIVVDVGHVVVAVIGTLGNGCRGLVRCHEVHVFDGLHELTGIYIGDGLLDNVASLIVLVAVNLGRRVLLDKTALGIVLVGSLGNLLHGEVTEIIEAALELGRLKHVGIVVELVLGVVGQFVVACHAIALVATTVLGHTGQLAVIVVEVEFAGHVLRIGDGTHGVAEPGLADHLAAVLALGSLGGLAILGTEGIGQAIDELVGLTHGGEGLGLEVKDADLRAGDVVYLGAVGRSHTAVGIGIHDTQFRVLHGSGLLHAVVGSELPE